MLLDIAERFTEPLKMDNLTFPQKANGVCNFRILYHAENVVIGSAGFLLCCNRIRTTFGSKVPVNFNRNVPCSGDAFSDKDMVD